MERCLRKDKKVFEGATLLPQGVHTLDNGSQGRVIRLICHRGAPKPSRASLTPEIQPDSTHSSVSQPGKALSLSQYLFPKNLFSHGSFVSRFCISPVLSLCCTKDDMKVNVQKNSLTQKQT